ETQPANSELSLWDVPFAEWKGLSAWVIKERDAEDFTVVVAPLSEKSPKENHPKYLLRFQKVLTLLAFEEACTTQRQYYKMSGWVKGRRAYRWVASPWVEGYKGIFWPDRDRLRHYCLLGDDNIIEVISIGEPEIERVDAKRF